jgi:hypothetical protein
MHAPGWQVDDGAGIEDAVARIEVNQPVAVCNRLAPWATKVVDEKLKQCTGKNWVGS